MLSQDITVLTLFTVRFSCAVGTQGGNLIMAGDKDMSELMREIAGEFGVAFDKRRTAVIDHFTYEPSLDKRWVG